MLPLLIFSLLQSFPAGHKLEPVRLYVGLPSDVVIAAGDRGAVERADTVKDIVEWVRKDKAPKVVIVDDKQTAQAELYITYRAIEKTGRRVQGFGGWTDELARTLKAQLRVGGKTYDFEVSDPSVWNFRGAAGRLLGKVEGWIENNRALLFAR